jgi:hypothetical protein
VVATAHGLHQQLLAKSVQERAAIIQQINVAHITRDHVARNEIMHPGYLQVGRASLCAVARLAA